MPYVIAHRGASARAPENTFSAFSQALYHGVNFIECDICILKDDTFVISHDINLSRCGNVDEDLINLDKNSIAEVDVGSWFSSNSRKMNIPTLEQFIKFCNQYSVNVNLELKFHRQVQLSDIVLIKFLDLVNRFDKHLRVIISSFNHQLIAQLKNVSNIQNKFSFALVFSHKQFIGVKQCLQTADDLGVEYIHLNNRSVTKEVVYEIVEKEYQLNVFTVNNLQRANQLFNWGVNGVFSDIPEKFPKKYLDNNISMFKKISLRKYF